MNIIITMAGAGRRFKETGIDIPKYKIEVKGRTLFEWSLHSLRNFYECNFIFITQKEHNDKSFIIDKSKSLGIGTLSVLELDSLTNGQAETALRAEALISDPARDIIIYNIDTYVEPDQLKREAIRGAGWIPAFEAGGDRWSFVKIDHEYQVLDITEKIRISNYGTIGLYYFSSFDLFKKIYSEYHFDKGKERYIAPMYKAMLAQSFLPVYAHLVDKKAVHVLGTPEDILQFDPEFFSD